METLRILSFILNCIIMTNGEDTTVVNLTEELAALNKSVRQELSARGKDKAVLRYGFHQTDLCKDYERAFVCVRKCLDIGYDVAYSDKRCKCTCYRKKEKARYTPAGRPNGTEYRLGTPTTKLPAWAQPPTPPPAEPLHDSEEQENKEHSNVTGNEDDYEEMKHDDSNNRTDVDNSTNAESNEGGGKDGEEGEDGKEGEVNEEGDGGGGGNNTAAPGDGDETTTETAE